MLVSLLTTYLGFGVDLPRGEVFNKIGVDKQACLISVHNLFSQIYI
jgi:hypothetical protein